MDFILRETGATTKDDLSVVLGEFDIRSGSDSFDTNRFDSVKGYLIKTSFSSRKNVRLEIDPIVHERYKSPKWSSNDIALLKVTIIIVTVNNVIYIALLKLEEAVNLEIFPPACLAPADVDYSGQNARVYGKFDVIR